MSKKPNYNVTPKNKHKVRRYERETKHGRTTVREHRRRNQSRSQSNFNTKKTYDHDWFIDKVENSKDTREVEQKLGMGSRWIDDRPEYYFHGTVDYVAEKAKNEGLESRGEQGVATQTYENYTREMYGDAENTPPGLWVTNNLNAAAYYALLQQHEYMHQEHPMNLDRHIIVIDPSKVQEHFRRAGVYETRNPDYNFKASVQGDTKSPYEGQRREPRAHTEFVLGDIPKEAVVATIPVDSFKQAEKIANRYNCSHGPSYWDISRRKVKHYD